MVRINGKKFKIYELDSLDSFRYRLADSLGTLESFLYFPKGITDEDIRDKKRNIVVEDLLEEIKDSSKKNTSVVTLVKNIQTKIGSKTKFDRGKEIVKLWLAYNNQLKNDFNTKGKISLDTIGNTLQESKIYITSSQIHTDWKETDKIKKSIQNRLYINKQIVENTLNIFQEYINIEESSAYTEFEIERVEFILTLNLRNLTLLEMFNSIQLNPMVPFATTNNFYKILQDFIPPDEWADSSDESIILHVYQKNFVSTSANLSNYETAIVKVDSETEYITTDIAIKHSKNNISREEFTDRFISVFRNMDISVDKVTESKVSGVFYFPLLRLDKYVFADIVMNDEIFSKLITLDDHDKATKNKAGIYIHFEHPTTGYITATLTEKIMIKGDPTMKNVDLDFFEPGGPFIRVKVSKANNEKSVQIFQEILGKLFVLYEAKKDKIIEFYKNYIPNFGDIAPLDEVKNSIKHSEIAPDLFVTGYTTSCKPERMPTIISEEEAIKAKSDGKSVIKFPRDIPEDKNAFRFPMDGEAQNYYTCENPGFKYVGLKDNNLKNSDMYPYVPCCFGRDQTKKPKYLHYFEGKELFTDDKKQNIIKTDKILDYNQFGTLPRNIENLFTIIDPDPKFEYVRKGVYTNKNSFINVVMEALNDETNILDIDGEDAIEDALIEERLSFLKKDIVPLCRQELYDKTTEKIMDLIKDQNVYFDPKLFIHILEDRFDCNIFLFTKKFLDGEMTLPRHIQAYYKNRNRKRCIYVYEHMGSTSDRAKYPQCELIVRYNTKKSQDNIQYSFTFEEARNIRNVFSRLRKSYALNKTISETYLPLNSSIKVNSQWIDSYGKTRRINVSFNNQIISLIVNPMQPIKAKETTKNDILLTNIPTAMKLADSLGIEIVSQTIIGDITKELNGVLGNVNISIPIHDRQKINGILEKTHGHSFTEKHESSLDKYNYNKKLARYLSEYTLWKYSSYLNNNGIVDITDDNIAQFGNKFFVVKPNYNYGNIEKTFKVKSPILEKGKIIVHNDETIKRLIYVLRLSVQRNVDAVRKYHERKVIQNYYVDITDFDKYNEQVILFGEESVEKWIIENNIIYTINNEIQIGTNTPYFFKNSLIDNNVYLAQNTQNLDKATDIAVSWVRKGNNVGIYAENMKPVTFTLYSYINSDTIMKGRKIKGEPFSEEVKILGYKIDNNPEYTVLLPL